MRWIRRRWRITALGWDIVAGMDYVFCVWCIREVGYTSVENVLLLFRICDGDAGAGTEHVVCILYGEGAGGG